MIDIQAYANEIVKSQPNERVAFLIDEVRDNMKAVNTRCDDMGSVRNEETDRLPVIIRKALAEKQKLERAAIGIWDRQLFAGCFTLRNEKVVNSYALPDFAFPEEIAAGEKEGFGVYSMFGHISPNYPRMLQYGTSGLKEMAAQRLKTAKSEKSAAFLKAAQISLEGLEIFAQRHVQMLREKIAHESDGQRRQELCRTMEALDHSPQYPARNYFEACQASWLMHLALQLTDNYLALGRPDQYLYPYLEKDLRDGKLTVEEAQEITDCFLLKFNERAQDNEVAARGMDIAAEARKEEQKWVERKLTDIGQQRYNIRDKLDALNHWNQNVIIGGTIPQTGEDATNLVTVMILESFRRIRMTNPVLSVRFHKNSPAALYRQTAITLKTGGGLPCLYNDETVVKAYKHFGIPESEARDYANNGCWECILPGKTDFYFIKLNALKCMEWTLNHGKTHVDHRQEAPDQGDVSEITDFEELYQRVLANIRYVMETGCRHILKTQHMRSIVAPTPLLSALLDGPIEKGLDMTEMGARFIVAGMIAEGVSHVIDSLCAIKQIVFEQKLYTLEDVVRAIDNNFIGSERLRAKLASCPKYGANQPEADEIGARLMHDYAAIMKEIDDQNPEMKFMPGVCTFSWYIAVGNATGASADGRFLAEPVASNFSPSANAMTRGIVGAMQSFAKMNLDVLPLGSPLDIGISEKAVAGEEGTQRLEGLIRTFVQTGGNLMTISVADVETLRKAQQEPEKYKDLRVRMGGWSAYFTMLSKEQQELHIRKSAAGVI